jgi:hypothetical protein
VAVGSPVVARTARGLSDAAPTSTSHRLSASEATNSTTARASYVDPRPPAPHHVDSVVYGTDSDVRCDGPGRQVRGQLGVDAVHRRLVSLHPAVKPTVWSGGHHVQRGSASSSRVSCSTSAVVACSRSEGWTAGHR